VTAPPPFQTFLDAHREEVLRFLVAALGPNDAQDCFQDTFLAALRAYPRLGDGRNLRAWALTIASRKAIDAHRRRARHALPTDALPERPEAGGQDDVAERDPALWEAVRALPPATRAAVVLRHVHDLGYADIAAALGCSEAAARQRVRAGLVRLREEWRS